MGDKAIYSVDTVETITDNDKIYVNTGDNIKQIKRSDLFIDINSNLDTLEFGEVAGGYNIWNEKTTIEKIWGEECLVSKDFIEVNPSTKIYVNCTSLDLYTTGMFFNQYDSNKEVIKTEKIFRYNVETVENCKYIKFGFQTSYYGSSYKNDTCVTISSNILPYEPYIPSVKMLADEVKAQNDSLGDYGLDNVYDGRWIQSGESWITTEDYISANENDIVVVKCDTVTSNGGFFVQCFDSSSETAIQTLDSWTAKEAKFTLPSGTTRIKVRVGNPKLTPETAGHIGVYINNAIDELKNDLGGLSFSVSGTTLSITDGTNTWTLSN